MTSPEDVLDQLGIGPGSKIDFRGHPDGTIEPLGKEVNAMPSRVERFRGHAEPWPGTDEIHARPLFINDIVFAELAVRVQIIELLDAIVAGANLGIPPIPRPALFPATEAFGVYRKRGGTRIRVFQDFLIGAQRFSFRFGERI